MLVGTFVAFGVASYMYMYYAELRYTATAVDFQRTHKDHRTDVVVAYKERLGNLTDSSFDLITKTYFAVIGDGTTAKLFDETTYIQKVLLSCNIVGLIPFGGAKLIDKANRKHFLSVKYFLELVSGH